MADFIRVGDVLIGFCGGFFGRDSFGDKRVEAVGADWVVAREMHRDALPVFAQCEPNDLLEYREASP